MAARIRTASRMLWEHCKSSLEANGFVGLKRDAKGFNAYFPLGYRLPKDDETAAMDIELLLKLLGHYDQRFALQPLMVKSLLNQLQQQIYVEQTKFSHGVRNFSSVWEYLVCQSYGNAEANAYYPECFWHIAGEKHIVGRLKPDCIKIDSSAKGNVITIIDAKYYKYGITRKIKDLPKATDIQKQITYGEYLARTTEKGNKVVNMFILPFEGQGNIVSEKFGTASGTWKNSKAAYIKIEGLLVDTKALIQNIMKKEGCNNGSID